MAFGLDKLAGWLKEFPYFEKLFPPVWNVEEKEDLKLLTRKEV